MTLSCRSPVRGTSSLEMVFLSWREGSELKINKAAICLQQPHRALALSHFQSFISGSLLLLLISISYFVFYSHHLPSSLAFLCGFCLSSLSPLSGLYFSHVSPLVSVSLFIFLSSVCFPSSHGVFLALFFLLSLLSRLFVLHFFYQYHFLFSLSFSYFSASLISALFPLTAGSDGKESACKAGHPVSIPGLGRSPGEGNGNPLHYSCLENPIGRGAWQAAVHGCKSWTQLSDYTYYCKCKGSWHSRTHESDTILSNMTGVFEENKKMKAKPFKVLE